MEEALLKSLGLTESEARVYLALIRLGSSSQGPIVKEAGVASSKVYGLLNKLIDKGLASYVIRSGVKHFESAPPSRLLDYLSEKENEIQKQREALKELVPILDKQRGMAWQEPEAQIFRGLEGAATAFDDVLKELKAGEEFYVLGISKLPQYFEKWVLDFHRRRAKRGIRCRVVVNELARETGEKYEAIPRTEVRYVQRELFTPVVFVIYKEKTLLSISLDGIWIRIDSKNLTEGLRVYAHYMWSLGKPR
ncbi:MAG TPA: helix-turn-helix domain-containing protein [Oligoflexia bacterium]|nr:helix-turn-helix domain-containing protein [Oligoflexia bacterium]